MTTEIIKSSDLNNLRNQCDFFMHNDPLLRTEIKLLKEDVKNLKEEVNHWRDKYYNMMHNRGRINSDGGRHE